MGNWVVIWEIEKDVNSFLLGVCWVCLIGCWFGDFYVVGGYWLVVCVIIYRLLKRRLKLGDFEVLIVVLLEFCDVCDW